MEHQFVDSGCVAIVICENFAANLEKILDKTKIKTVVLTGIGEWSNLPAEMQSNLKKMVPPHNVKSVCNVREACTRGAEVEWEPYVGVPWDVIML